MQKMMKTIIKHDMSNNIMMNEKLMLAKELVTSIEENESEKIEDILHQLCEFQENNLYQKIGKLTRGLHQSLNDVNNKSDYGININDEMSDARNRLNHVLALTEASSHKTLTAIEHSKPILNNLSERAECLQDILQSHLKKPAKCNGFGFIAAELGAYLYRVVNDVSNINSELNDVLMSQGNQDISGQIIQRVITIVQDMENSLVDILQSKKVEKHDKVVNKVVSDIQASGPAVPGIEHGDVMHNQQEVDDLLSTLGF